jgi:sugar phosphate isomerase/epimerase
MHLGMPTLIENKNLEENAKLCYELGLDFLELNMNLPMFQLNQLSDTKKLESIAKEYHIYYTIHLDENCNITDFNPDVAQAYQNTVIGVIRVAKVLEIPLLNLHLNKGVYFTLPHKKIYLLEQYREWYLQKIREFRDRCQAEIGSSPLLISIENTDGYCTFQLEAIASFLESKVFSLTWDIGHSHAAGKTDEPFLLEHKNRLVHFHMHDALEHKNHLALGTGEINLRDKFALAQELGTRCVLETKTIEGLRHSVRWVHENGIG